MKMSWGYWIFAECLQRKFEVSFWDIPLFYVVTVFSFLDSLLNQSKKACHPDQIVPGLHDLPW